ncbi:cilia- and flagella-associated protein 36 isoform X1 [Aethina tumida]|uniref:cilia- and flagella-associated protein 36 isoform X1 n=1 Tax=Aethina tumida TaxID=116153 RepID=UPI0021490A2F|nr:cilia- and flagella-associated protein 36 isoform X1 [Aethina tumida]
MEDENSWVFDSLVAFLNGPIWNAPLESFIEEKSLIFEPNVQDNENYRGVYEEFKNLVDFMLGNFMEDIGITPEQFEHACSEGRKHQVSFDNNLFEQIWAANDYEMFKRMMAQRNVELQLQALELIEQKYGITPESFIPNKRERHTTIQEIPVIIENSKLEKAIMDEVAKKFPEETTNDVMEILEDKEVLQESLKQVKEKVQERSDSATPSTSHEEKATEKEPIIEKPVEEKKPSKPATKEADAKSKEVSVTINFSKFCCCCCRFQIDARELKKRQEYLRAQRDKLVALKKEERKKQLNAEADTSDKFRIRPKSAKAAEAVLAGDKSPIEPQQLQIRKSLAERLKSEVVLKTRSDVK